MALRVRDTQTLLISEDQTTNPKKIRLQEQFDDVDLTTLSEVNTRQETFPVGTHSIDLGNIAEGRFIYVKPIANTGQVQLELNGSNALTLRNGKPSKLWTLFNQVNLIVSGNAAEVLIVVAGE